MIGNLRGLAALHLRAAALYALVGMGLGFFMGATHDFTLAPVHAHLNLLGWASCALYGLVLLAHGAQAAGRLAVLHLAIAHLGAISLTLGLALMLTLGDNPTVGALIGVGSIASVLSMLLFVILVFKLTATPAAVTDRPAAMAVPAE